MLFNTGRHGEDIRVEDDVFRRETHLFGENFVGSAANFDFTRAGIGLPLLIKGHHHHCRAVATQKLRMMNKGFHALFHRNRVDDAFTLNALQPFFDNLPFGGVDHDWYTGNIRLTGNQAEETHHRRFGVEHPLIHIDINNLRAAFYLLTGDIQRFAVFLFFDQALKFGRAGDVSTFADVDKQAIVANVQRLQAGKAAGDRDIRQLARRQTGNGAAHRRNMLRRSAAAAANDIQEARFRPFANLFRHGVGVEVVLAESVRQAGVRVRGDVAFGNPRQFLDVLAQFIWSQRAVKAKSERLGVAQRVIKGFGRLAGKRTARGVGDGAGNHDRQINAQRFKLFFHRKHRRFRIQGVKDGLNQNQICATFHQRFSGFTVGRHQLIEGDITKRRVVDVRRNGGRAVSWTKHARNKAWFFWCSRRPFIGAGARQFGRRIVNFRRQGFHPVIRHRNGCRVKGVGFDDIRASLKVGVVDSGDHLRLAEYQRVIVAFQVAGPVGKALPAEIFFM